MVTGKTVRSVDFNTLGGTVAQEAGLRCWKSKGIEVAIVGAQYPQAALSNLLLLDKVGIKADVYIYMLHDRDPVKRVTDVTKFLGDFNVGTLWLDYEDSGAEKYSAAQNVIHCAKAVDAASGGKYGVGIYTRRYWWRDMMDNSHAFSYLPLWDARYINDAQMMNPVTEETWDRPRVPFTPYGGWQRATVTQWHNTTELCGIGVDLNDYEVTRMKYTDEVLDGVFKELLAAIAHQGDVDKAVVTALFDHVSATGADHDELAQQAAQVEDIEDDLAQLAAEVEG